MPRSAKATKATKDKSRNSAVRGGDDTPLEESEAIMTSPRTPCHRPRSRSPHGYATPGDAMSSGDTTVHGTPRGEMDPQATPQTGGMHSGDTGRVQGGRHCSRVCGQNQNQIQAQAEPHITLSQAIQAQAEPHITLPQAIQAALQMTLPTGGILIFGDNLTVHFNVQVAPAQNQEATTQRQLDFQ